MNRTRVEWCDWSWNPLTGCLHGCEYCYAREIAHRFGGHIELYDPGTHVAEAGEKPFPFGFGPTFYPGRLNEPAKVKKPGMIFVCSMGDLFGDWVPTEWIRRVFEAMEMAPRHRYVVLTKNPARALRVAPDLIRGVGGDRTYIGTSITGIMSDDEVERLHALFGLSERGVRTVLSLEPYTSRMPMGYLWPRLGWLIIGGLTGRKQFAPPWQWVRPLVEWARGMGVPVFIKDNCHYPLVVREWPKGMEFGVREVEL